MSAESIPHNDVEGVQSGLGILHVPDSLTVVDASPSLSPISSSNSHSQSYTPTSSVPNTPILPTRPDSPTKRALLDDSNAFLTAVAAQERRVLELKEELTKAQTDLESLKRRWAVHEANKKRNELSGIEELRSPQSLWSTDSPEKSVPGPSLVERRVERRRAGSSAIRNRKVFSGSRHVRTLSLLSPQEHTHRSTAHQPTHDENGGRSAPSQNKTHDESNVEKDIIFETGKQLVGDFRQGLCTFFEDLRQVTVGEALATDSQRSVRNSVSHRSRDLNSFPSDTSTEPTAKATNISSTSGNKGQPADNQVDSGVQSAGRQGTTTALDVPAINPELTPNDSGDHLIGPQTDITEHDRALGESEHCSPCSEGFEGTDSSSPRTSVSSVSKDMELRSKELPARGDLAWPALSKFTPGNLTRTATHLMNEWEKSLRAPDTKIA